MVIGGMGGVKDHSTSEPDIQDGTSSSPSLPKSNLAPTAIPSRGLPPALPPRPNSPIDLVKVEHHTAAHLPPQMLDAVVPDLTAEENSNEASNSQTLNRPLAQSLDSLPYASTAVADPRLSTVAPNLAALDETLNHSSQAVPDHSPSPQLSTVCLDRLTKPRDFEETVTSLADPGARNDIVDHAETLKDLEDMEVHEFLRRASKHLQAVSLESSDLDASTTPLPRPADYGLQLKFNRESLLQSDWLRFGEAYLTAQLERNCPSSLLGSSVPPMVSTTQQRLHLERCYVLAPPELWKVLLAGKLGDICRWKHPRQSAQLLSVSLIVRSPSRPSCCLDLTAQEPYHWCFLLCVSASVP